MDDACKKKREAKQRAQAKWVERHKVKYLANKREYAGRPDTLARRRDLYSRRRHDPEPEPPPTPDLWAKAVNPPSTR